MSVHDTDRLTDEELDRLRGAFASPEFMAVVHRDPETVGEDRNSARERARQTLRRYEKVESDDLRGFLDGGGHYFDALFHGNLSEAFVRADIANIRLLLDTFGRQYLVERLIAEEGWTHERAAGYVDGRIEEFGDGLIL